MSFILFLVNKIGIYIFAQRRAKLCDNLSTFGRGVNLLNHAFKLSCPFFIVSVENVISANLVEKYDFAKLSGVKSLSSNRIELLLSFRNKCPV